MIICITALSDKGKTAIEKHISESAGISKFNPNRIMYNKFFEQKVLSRNPLTLQVKVKNPFLARQVKYIDLANKIEEALLKNNAEPEDYDIREVKIK